MPWTNDPNRFVVPEGLNEAEAELLRRQLQIIARLDTLEAKMDRIIRMLQARTPEKDLKATNCEGK